ncbi:hypothetical protein BDP81DRAFT_430665 [Colletotrichum phormii]|uniref:Uncharacterized protein n=1 Tax=Colletotrichum phormii TaxID=359342 RepID=A0AAI9ZN34_9PEZI|nr:uncharacterized protein BDP81DRAFT_430665 [Colletotrichum phormii]KAK1635015.1 hypothetical protein BDP81DRAFT_430665 [Colletotrichum phormii]
MLSDVVFSAETSLKPAAILYQAANLVEELSVSFDRTPVNRWISIPSILLEKDPPTQGNNDCRSTSIDLEKPMPLGSWFLSFDSRMKASVKSYKSCLECQNGTRYSTSEQALQHRALCHSDQHCRLEFERRCPNDSTEWVMLTAGVKISSLFEKLRKGWSTRDRIDCWMLDVLHKSEHLLVVFRCSAFLDISSNFSSITAQASQSNTTSSRLWGSMWTPDLLGAFEKQVEALDSSSCTIQSDGAVYSHRDDAVFEGEQFWDDLGINVASYDILVIKNLK